MASELVQFQTIDQVISALSACDPSITFDPEITLRKIRVDFDTDEGFIKQTEDFVKWDDNDFNNLDITNSRYAQPCIHYMSTLGELVEELKKFRDQEANQGKLYSVTFNGSLVESPIIKKSAQFITNGFAWRETVLAAESSKGASITKSLSKFLTSVAKSETNIDEVTLFNTVQKWIESVPNCPADYVAYCIKNDDDCVVFDSKRGAENYLRRKDRGSFISDKFSFKLDMSSINIFKKMGPQVYVLDTELIEKVTSKMAKVQSMLANLAV